MSARVKYRDIARAIARENYGYITTQDAKDAGIPAGELPKLAARGGLENISYGLYRFTDTLPTPYDQYTEALIRVGQGSYLYGESVLALFNLADANPRSITIATPARTRASLPPFIRVIHMKKAGKTTIYEGLPSQTVCDALQACLGKIDYDKLMGAVQQSYTEGLLTTRQYRHVTQEFTAWPTQPRPQTSTH